MLASSVVRNGFGAVLLTATAVGSVITAAPAQASVTRIWIQQVSDAQSNLAADVDSTAPVYFYDNGKLMPGSPATPVTIDGKHYWASIPLFASGVHSVTVKQGDTQLSATFLSTGSGEPKQIGSGSAG
ncbi:hypothetical protein [Nocardia tengchongensis]|uniref:hypothetical protein n=1 Tax=Nocardia tengchongensis TaxID=2055889 RepID=UPI00361F625B